MFALIHGGHVELLRRDNFEYVDDLFIVRGGTFGMFMQRLASNVDICI